MHKSRVLGYQCRNNELPHYQKYILINPAYFNICDGFILICNLHSKNSIFYIESQIENILRGRLSTEPPNILVLVNHEENGKMTFENQNNLEFLSTAIGQKFKLKLYNIDLSKSNLINKPMIEKFLTSVSLRKIKPENKPKKSRASFFFSNTKCFKEKNHTVSRKQVSLSQVDLTCSSRD
jgi:hypothetical protein